VCNRIHARRNIIIQYAWCVIAFKENPRLKLPEGLHLNQLILKHIFWNRWVPFKVSHLYEKKCNPKSDSAQGNLIVHEYDYVEDSSYYKHLNANRKKEK
jgi:hypothetical protein